MKYVTIASPNHKTFYVGRQLIGGTFSVIATCTSEDYAKRIAAAMNAEKLPKGKVSENAIIEHRNGKTWDQQSNQRKQRAA